MDLTDDLPGSAIRSADISAIPMKMDRIIAHAYSASFELNVFLLASTRRDITIHAITPQLFPLELHCHTLEPGKNTKFPIFLRPGR